MQFRFINALLFLSVIGSGLSSWGYASFIGYGYTSCMTCHYNPHGNGQLNDYGRALFATEIAARVFRDPKTTDEELGNQSSFLFSQPAPGMFKPSIKYREIYVTSSPGGSNATKKYVMQADAGFALHFDPNDKYILVMSAGYTPRPLNSDVKTGAWNYNLLSREHYLRVQLSDEQFMSVGLMDIVYGLRLVDHTGANRKSIGLDMNDQVHGVLYDYSKEKWLFGLHGFVGNQMRDEISRITGASTTLEYELREKLTVGASYLMGSTQTGKQTLFGLHSRAGVGKGSSLLTEWGMNKVQPKTGDATTGAYGIVSGTMRIIRGLDFESVFEMVKASMQDSSPENYKFSFGFIYFPAQRIELRVQASDNRLLSPSEVKGDTWFMQSQLHLSL